MYVVDRPRFDRHPWDETYTRLWNGDRLVVNALEACDWRGGELGACDETGDPDVPFRWYEPAGLADVISLGESVALLPPHEDGNERYWAPDFTELFGGTILFPPATWRAVLWRHDPEPADDREPLPKDFTPPPPTRRRLVDHWVTAVPEGLRRASGRPNDTAAEALPALLRRTLLAAEPGGVANALGACGRIVAWAAADPDAPAGGTLTEPGEPLVTLYLDGAGDAVPEWPALPVSGDGLALGGRVFRPHDGW